MSKFEYLHEAAHDGTIDDVKYFVEEKGVKVEEEDLSYPAYGASVEILEYLVSKGAKVNAKDHLGSTPLHSAACSNTKEVLEYLVSKGADVNARDHLGQTPMHQAASQNPRVEVLECLVANGVNVNVKTDGGMTPLHYAILNNPNVEVIKYLVSKGANVNVKNGHGFTPTDFAREHGKEHLLPRSGCYVATCVYGSKDCPELWTLRRYRDSKLSSSWFGRLFIRIYYAISPKIVELFGNKKWFNGLCKPILNKIVYKLQSKGMDSNPYSDL